MTSIRRGVAISLCVGSEFLLTTWRGPCIFPIVPIFYSLLNSTSLKRFGALARNCVPPEWVDKLKGLNVVALELIHPLWFLFVSYAAFCISSLWRSSSIIVAQIKPLNSLATATIAFCLNFPASTR